MSKFSKLNKEYSDLKELMGVYQNYRATEDAISTAKEMIAEEDEEMRVMAKEELQELEPKLRALEEELEMLLLPKDPDDAKDVLFEIRSGTGGDEASIFAGDLYRMYTKYFESQNWTVEVLFSNEGTVGGFNKVELEVHGKDVFGKLKYESGAHRVQRVPKTESQGRVHTSAATVAVMPKLEMEDLDIKTTDLKIDVFRASGAGGQHVNRTESAVRITHIPTGAVSECQEARSQIKNREIALTRLYNKIQERMKKEHEATISANRKSLVGSGDRSDKIRTYNYPQNRLTDHRINLTLYNLDQVMEGDIDGIIKSLQIAERAEIMKGVEE